VEVGHLYRALGTLYKAPGAPPNLAGRLALRRTSSRRPPLPARVTTQART